MPTSQDSIKIYIDSEKKMRDLIKFYFEIIKRRDLFGDQTIVFIKDAKPIPHNSKDLIKNFIHDGNDSNIFLIADTQDKI